MKNVGNYIYDSLLHQKVIKDKKTYDILIIDYHKDKMFFEFKEQFLNVSSRLNIKYGGD